MCVLSVPACLDGHVEPRGPLTSPLARVPGSSNAKQPGCEEQMEAVWSVCVCCVCEIVDVCVYLYEFVDQTGERTPCCDDFTVLKA